MMNVIICCMTVGDREREEGEEAISMGISWGRWGVFFALIKQDQRTETTRSQEQQEKENERRIDSLRTHTQTQGKRARDREREEIANKEVRGIGRRDYSLLLLFFFLISIRGFHRFIIFEHSFE